MGFKEGQLFLDSPNGTYYSGQFIHGKLIFQQEKVKSFRGLYVQMHGFCHVHWTTRHTRTVNGKEETYTVNHDSHEDYMNTRVYMLGGEAGEYTIQPGKYEYPFRFQLPNNCPSSFEGIYGHIRYEIKAVIDRAFRFDQVKKVMARVMAPLDLNLNPFCRLPLQLELQKLYHCCCMKSGSSDVSVKLPVAGYCPGQTIPIKLTCSNKGRVEINDIRLSINKKVTFIATSQPGKQILKDKVAEIRKGPILVNTNVNWSLDMVVPLQDVYNLTICQYIKVEYKFKVHLSPKGCHSNSELSHLIIIGTIPLMEFQDTQPTMFNVVLTDPNPDNSNHSNANPNPDYPPPYPGNLSNPQLMPYETKNSKIPRDVVGGSQSGETEINLPPSTSNAASQDTVSLHLMPAIAYAVTAAPTLDSPENTLPEKKY